MFKNILTVVLKRVLRFDTYALINIIGLAIGLASFIMITLYVFDEYSYDRYHTKADRIYRVTSVLDFNGVGEKSSSQPFPMAQALLENYPEYIESYVRFFNLQKNQFIIANKQKVFTETRFFYCDSNVFDVFDFKILKGNKDKVLINPFSIVITESMAKKYFEDTDPIGQTLLIDNYYKFEVTGVVKDVVQQSHFQFDFLASFSSLAFVVKNEKMLQSWVWNPCWTYLLLKKPESAAALEPKLGDFVSKYLMFEERQNYHLYLQALTDIHLNSQLGL